MPCADILVPGMLSGSQQKTHKRVSLGTDSLVIWGWLGRILLFKGLKASAWMQLWGKSNPNPVLLSSSPLLCMSVSLCACPSPLLPPFFSFITFWWRVVRFLLVPSCGPSPATELVQLGLLRSLGNLPVSERVQLAHLCQLGLHHGRLGVHREGDRPGGSHSGPIPLVLPPPAAHTALTAVATWKLRMTPRVGLLWGTVGGTRLRGFSRMSAWLLNNDRPEGKEGIWGIWRCEGFLPGQMCVPIHPPPSLPKQSTSPLDEPCHCVRLRALLLLSLHPHPLPLIENLLLSNAMILET